MTWMITNTGREHHLDGHTLMFNAPNIAEIAHALAQINRFTGHAKRPYSVAEHSLLVCSIANAEGATPIAQLAALMHDAHEAFTGDVSSPAKWSLGTAWSEFEHRNEHNTHLALGISTAMVSHRAAIKRWDLIALATERRDLTAYNPAVNHPWAILDMPGHEVTPITARLDTPERERQTWLDWKRQFHNTHDMLQAAIKASA